MDIVKAITKDNNIPPDLNIKATTGKLRFMEPQSVCLSHPAVLLLQSYANKGYPVDCGPNWSLEHIELLLQWGPHISGEHKEAILFLQKETARKVDQGYAKIVRWGDIKHHHPAQLKLLLVAMIPHKSKAFCCILDLSFGIRHKGQTLASVNSATNKKALPHSMVQLGQCIK